MLSDIELLEISESEDVATIASLTDEELLRLEELAARSIRAATPRAARKRINQIDSADGKIASSAAADILDRAGIRKEKSIAADEITVKLPPELLTAVSAGLIALMRNVTPTVKELSHDETKRS